MARTALIVKHARNKERILKAKRAGKKPVKPTQLVNRCGQCGRVHAYMREFDLCRICFRELASKGRIPGIKKSSW